MNAKDSLGYMKRCLDVTAMLLKALSSVVPSQSPNPEGSLEEDESEGPLPPEFWCGIRKSENCSAWTWGGGGW
jgi:hypothetical protein